MKELPEENSFGRKPQTEPQKEAGEKPEHKADIKSEITVKEKVLQEKVVETLPPEEGKKRFPLSTREIILVTINTFSVIFLIVLLIQLPAKAEELKKLRLAEAKDETATAFEFDKVQSKKEDYEKLKSLFVDESGIVRFVNEVEKFKGPDSSVQKVTFTTQKAVKDRSGNYGIPVIIEMTGSWEKIGKDMERIQILPFLFRPATFESKPTLDKPNSIDVRYGVFLYVKEDLVKK